MKVRMTPNSARVGVPLILSMLMLACAAPGPAPIMYGEDVCDYCGMTIVERGFGTELVTTKGKIIKFDSIECLAAFDVAGSIPAEQVHSRWVTDYNHAGTLVDVNDATFIHGESIRSPMAGGLCAVHGEDVAIRVRDASGGNILPWEGVCSTVAREWNVKPAVNGGS